MRVNTTKMSLLKSGLVASILLLASSLSLAATVELTAAPTQAALPDGQSVPMWGYSCGTAVDANCAASNPNALANWSPVVITVASGTPLTIHLTNNLTFGTNTVPTSLVIVGQLGGGLGGTPARTASPVHAQQGTTWPGSLGGIVGSVESVAVPLATAGTGYTTSSQATFTGGGGSGASAVVTSVGPSGEITGVAVTSAGSGYTSAPTVVFDIGTGALATANLTAADTPTFTPPDQAARVRSFGTEVVVGTPQNLTWSNLRPGTYLIESGTQPSIQGPMGLYGVLVVTDATYPGLAFDKDVSLVLSEIDPVQNAAVNTAVNTAGFSDTNVWSGQPGKCGDPAAAVGVVNTCYPPAVNYDPRYYLINGVSFDRSSTVSAVPDVPAAAVSGNVLLRFVNAGLRMHVPSVVNASMSLLAEDGNKLPGVPKVQNELFLAAGKTYDVTIKPKLVDSATYAPATYAVFDRALGLSTNNQHDGGMQAHINVAGGAATSSTVTAIARPDSYFLVAGNVLAVAEAGKGLMANDTGIYGVKVQTGPSGAGSALSLNSDGTFTYTPGAGVTSDSFSYCGNGATVACTTVTLAECTVASGCMNSSLPTAADDTYTSNIASQLKIPPPGILMNDTDPSGLLLKASAPINVVGGSVTLNPDGSFTAVPSCAPTCSAGSTITFNYSAVNSQNTASAAATVTLNFASPSNLAVTVKDSKTNVAIGDYRWIIEEDRTFWVDPKCQINSTDPAVRPAPPACPPLPVESLGYNFHTANMPVVATGCVGDISCEIGQTVLGAPAACDMGNGVCHDASKKVAVLPSQVHLDPNKRYYISVLPGDGINTTLGGAGGPQTIAGKDVQFDINRDCGPFNGPTGAWEPGGVAALCGHAMGGAQIAPSQSAVSIGLQETPLPTAKISVFVFEDDNPLNGENDAGGGVDVLAPNEPGLSGFEIKLFDQAGGLGDATGQITYDMFNMPVSNSLAGTMDAMTGLDACPIAKKADGLVGMVPTCPKFESDGKTLSPLAGQVVVANLYPGLYEIVATPGHDRIARGENWLQTNTLDGGKAHEAFIKPNEPGYFQEFGPGGFHVAIGFANPKVINDRKAAYCTGLDCSHTLNVKVANTHMSRTPDQRTFSSNSYDHYGFTTCYVSVGPADAEDFAFQACDADGKVSFTGMPNGTYKISVFDQWNDIMLDGLTSTVVVNGDTTKDFPATQWRTNLYTRTFIDTNGDGVSQEAEPGLPLVSTNIRYRDGSFGFFNNTDLQGYAGFNEVFPFMNWLVVDSYTTNYKSTGTHVVYDAGGQVDGQGGGTSGIANNLANTIEHNSLPTALRVPGARYCASADCPAGDATGGSTGRVDPAGTTTEGWQGLLGQNTFIEFAKKPFAPTENGGIMGHVIYASTRPFDDPALLLQLSWEPGVPRVQINLYQEGTAADGSKTLKLVDTTKTTSFDDWAQGFRSDGIPNMNCPGQDATSPFFATLKDSKMGLDPTKTALPNNSQFKCYDGWSQLNQAQPAPYDGMYKFPSVTSIDNVTGLPTGTNCSICVDNPTGDHTKMLPAGKYVVEVIVPSGFELVKEEDKNILLGDVYIAPVTQQFAGLGSIFIMPDQAAVNAYYNKNSPGGLNLTTNLGAQPHHEGDTGSVEAFWQCVGQKRIVPDYNSLFPGAGQAAPFAGAMRSLCDRKEVILENEMTALAKFYVFTPTHIAGHFTGTMTNDFASEFDPFSPQFGEKFGPPNLPVGMRDFSGKEVARVYADQWGIYNGLFFSSYGVNPPNPTGYVPQMSIACMNDPGPIPDPAHPGQMITDPSYSPAYSNFCYETPFMPGFTAYMDTPVIPTMAFADGYNLPDTEYPNGTPAIKSVISTAAAGPWVLPAINAASAGATITFTNVSINDVVSSVVANSTTLTGGSITCVAAGPTLCPAGNGFTAQNNRNNRMAVLVANSIAARSGTTGVTAAASGNTVTLTAVATGAALNGTTLTVNQTGITAGGTLAFAGGAVAQAAQMDITITALGDKVVQNPNFSGPNSTTAPYNQKTITRHYGFGDRPSTCPVTGDCPAATVGGVAMTNVTTWNDTTITGTVPNNVPLCNTSNSSYKGVNATARCGELVITAANGKQSIDAITVTAGGSAPWIVTESAVTAPSGKSVNDYTSNFGRFGFSPIQTAIDSADSGDLILVQPGTYRENLIMWKPVRLQGVGASAVTINADSHPAGKMDQWRRQVNCVFGLTLNGVPNLNNANYDPSNTYSCPDSMHQRADRIPFEAIVGWDATGNGNLAQVLQEPTLMGAYEGAGITVLGRGVRIPGNSSDFWGVNATGGAGAFTDGSVYLTSSNNDCAKRTDANGRDYGTSNFFCNPSLIDGVSVINSSQGGGGLFIHGWGHNLEVANARISGNHGTLAGAVNLGNGETPDAFINDGVECGPGSAGAMPCPPTVWRNGGATNGGARYSPVTNAAIAFQFNTNVRIHNNMLYNNASIGDALFSGTPAGAGAITVSAGADGYQIDHNWIAGNLSTGDGGGLQHLGLSFNGKINNNYILFNQSTNPTLPTNGGGVIIEGANLDRFVNGQECGSFTDQDCPPGLGEGAGAALVIDANLILGNSAESGSGGGLRIQQVNGSDVVAFPRSSNNWYDVTVTNNIIANNVAGWDGGGVSMQDSLKVSFINNTVASNDTTASAGSLFKTIGAVNSSSGAPGCHNDPNNAAVLICPDDGNARHGPQAAGLVVVAHTANLQDAMNAPGVGVTCPNGFGYTGNDCRRLSKPALTNDLFWQNRAFSVNVVGLGSGNQSQQNLIALTPVLNQTATGGCASGADARDIGLRVDDIASGAISATNNKLTVTNSIFTSDWQNVITGSTTNIVGGTSPVIAQYCNGARVPPENCAAQGSQVTQASCHGYNTPAGASETTNTSQLFTFSGIQPTATVDEGHNWLNLVYGPLTLNRTAVGQSSVAPELMVASAATGTAGGAYSVLGTSSSVNRGANTVAPTKDFFGNTRLKTTANPADIGAVEFPIATGSTLVVANPAPLVFNSVVGTTTTRDLIVSNNGTTGFVFNAGTGTVTAGFTRLTAGVTGNCPTAGATAAARTLAAGAACTIRVQWVAPAGATSTPVTGSVVIVGNAPVTNAPVAISANASAVTRQATIDPASITFANQLLGTSSPAQSLILTNTGNTQLTGLSYSLTSSFTRPGGTAGGTCGATLDVNASCYVNVQFSPTSQSSYPKLLSGTLTINGGGSGTVITGSPVAFSGTVIALPVQYTAELGTGTLDVLTQTLNFGNNNVNTIRTNTLTLTVNVPSVTFGAPTVLNTGGSSGANPTPYALGATNTCTGTKTFGNTCTISISFNPRNGNQKTGTLSLPYTGSTGSPAVLNLTGN